MVLSRAAREIASSSNEFRRRRFGLLFVTAGDDRLMIPVEFATKFMKHPPLVMKLVTGDRIRWAVQVEQINGHVYLTEGWRRFCDVYEIAQNYILQFTYFGYDKMRVKIYDTHSMELDVSDETAKEDLALIEEREKALGGPTVNQTDVTQPICNSEPCESPKAPELLRKSNVRKGGSVNSKPVLVSGRRHINLFPRSLGYSDDEHVETSETGDSASDDSEDSSFASFDSLLESSGEAASSDAQVASELVMKCCAGPVNKCKRKADDTEDGKLSAGKTRPGTVDLRATFTRASALVEAVDVAEPYEVKLPLELARDCLKVGMNEVTLKVPSGGMWIVSCVLDEYAATVSSGWKRFVVDNNVHEGDTCVFMPDPNDSTIWDVSIVQPRRG